MMKSSVKHIHSGGKLTFHEFQVLLHRVSNFINNRPQGLDFDRQEGELDPITPNDLLQPSNLQDVEEDMTKYNGAGDKYTHRMRFQ